MSRLLKVLFFVIISKDTIGLDRLLSSINDIDALLKNKEFILKMIEINEIIDKKFLLEVIKMINEKILLLDSCSDCRDIADPAPNTDISMDR